MVILVISRVLFLLKKSYFTRKNLQYIKKTDKYTNMFKKTPLELSKWLKCTTNIQNIPKP